jgi:imidazolonepropionase
MLLFENIKALYGVYAENPGRVAGKEMALWPHIENAYLAVKDGKILDFGTMDSLSRTPFGRQSSSIRRIDVSGRMILPGFCDSHTHIVFAGSRENEFIDKINGLSYAEIARRGGGILNSAKKLASTGEDELFEQSAERVTEVISKGTTALEIKSGYGLDTENELKILRVIRRLKAHFPIHITSTLLAAHALPPEFKEDKEGFIQMVLDEMIPAAAKEQLADFVDVFCETDFFTEEDTLRISEKAAAYGIKTKIHGNQLGHSGGVRAAVKANAVSVDHLEFLNSGEITLLASSNVMPTVLPNCSFFLRMQYAPAREIISAGLPLCIATDFNPGSAPSGDMLFAASLACIQMKLLPEEAFCAATINGAAAMNLEAVTGTITPGKWADFIITRPAPSLAFLPYRFTKNHIGKVYAKGYEVFSAS